MTCVSSEMLFLCISYVNCKYFVCQSIIQQEKLSEIIFRISAVLNNHCVTVLCDHMCEITIPTNTWQFASRVFIGGCLHTLE